ncbi:MAG: hypothetical protein QOD77_85 [Thermoplasmata archaeon]|jgi:aryl-alcohol dehydrogenase-like predicted oxidoreductase|nr:hypothetical protein [Thermoplasmata archaeon]
MIPGRATAAGTAAFLKPSGHARVAQGLSLSSLGLGSYLAGEGYEEAALAALAGGVNVLDTSSNYRDQASERDLGRALRRFVAGGGDRAGVVVVSKAGYVHGDCDQPDDDAWFEAEYLHAGILKPGELLSGHTLAPAYLLHELERSRRNLGVATLDAMLLHNPEHQLEWGVAPDLFYPSVEAAFEALERACDAGHLAMYGVATWDGFRVGPEHNGHLSLVKLVHHAGQARMKAGGRASEHHFRVLELPVNLAMPEAAMVPTQPFRFGAQTILDCARDLDMVVLASASLMQMRIAGRIPPEYAAAFGTASDAETALQFTRSVPGVSVALVGMGTPAHARANAAFAATRSPQPEVVRTLLGTGGAHGW